MIPTYEDCKRLIKEKGDKIFYENVYYIDNYKISVINYRLASYTDFLDDETNPKEMRGLTFVFNEDGTLFNRYILLEKFFNLNQVTETMYKVVKDYKIKHINNKEDGSVASFIKLPNGKIVGKSKMSFESEQADGINRCYENNIELREFVNWTLDNDISAIFEYVAPSNRIVLRYLDEELILLKLRDNKTGKHLDLKDYLDKIGSIKIAEYEENKTIDELIHLMDIEIDKEGYVVHTIDNNGNDFFFKIKTTWYCERHGLLTDDLYREHILVNYILDDKIDDILGQIPEDEIEARTRINKMIDIIRVEISKVSDRIDELFQEYLKIKNGNDNTHYIKKFIAQNFRKDPLFGELMIKVNSDLLKETDWKDNFKTYSDYVSAIEKGNTFELAKKNIRKKCVKLESCRKWLNGKMGNGK